MLKPLRKVARGSQPVRISGKPRHGQCEEHGVELVCDVCQPEVNRAAAILARAGAANPSPKRSEASRSNGRLGGHPKHCPKCTQKMKRNPRSDNPRWVCICGHTAHIIKRNRLTTQDPFRNLTTQAKG